MKQNPALSPKSLRYTVCPQKLCPVCVTTVEELHVQSSLFLNICIGQASNYSLRLCMSQSDWRLLIYGREKAK